MGFKNEQVRNEQIASEQISEAIRLRHKLNKNAEPSWQEFKSTKIIKDFLEKNNIDYTSLPTTGLIVSKGDKNKPRVLLRSDLDALNFGDKCIHACGHDLHSAALACALKEIDDVIAIFQPSEEDYPSGAIQALDYLPDFKFAVAVHVDPTLPFGAISIREGFAMGSIDVFEIRIKGKSAHSAFPTEGKDAIAAAAEVILEFEKFRSEKIAVVISIVNGGTKENLLCDEVILKGTLRTLDNKLKKKFLDSANQICKIITKKRELEIEFNILPGGYPPLYNDPEIANLLRERLKAEFGEDKIIRGPRRLSNDDFGFYSKKGPICQIRLGTGGGALHVRDFYPDDKLVEVCKRIYLLAANT